MAETETFNGYCVKCRKKTDFEGVRVVGGQGRNMAQGPCPTCGTKVNRLLPSTKGKSTVQGDGPESVKGLLQL